MSTLSLTKSYGNTQLLFADDVHQMWDELEAFVNGNITADNLNSGIFNLHMVDLTNDISWTMGTTDSAYMRYDSAEDDWIFANTSSGDEIIFKVNDTEVARIDNSKSLILKKDVYYPSDATFSLKRMIGNYTKPVLVYTDSTTIDIENNTETSSGTLIVFPSGPIETVEDISLTHKFRRIKTNASANGYLASHTGAADSGVRVGVTLSANTWYFVYAAKILGGDDIGEFIGVIDSTSPDYANHSTLDGRYGADNWVYLGAIRIGHGEAATTTLVAFSQDKSGWTQFTGRAETGDYFGIKVLTATVTQHTTTGLQAQQAFTNGESGDSIPAVFSAFQGCWRVEYDAGDSEKNGVLAIGSASTNLQFHLPSFADGFDGTEPHAGQFKIANSGDMTLYAARIFGFTADDFTLKVYIQGFLDEYV
jgi:hypothetical protein